MSSFITPILKGRLGNTAMQIAAAIGTAIKHGVEYKIPKNPYFHVPYNSRLRETPFLTYNEPAFHYNEIPFKGVPMVIDGYFQSYKYWDKATEEVKTFFNIDNTEKFDDWCSIHVRRSDYLPLPNHHPVLSPEYYYQAIDDMLSKGYTKFMIFSDDLEWCHSFFNQENFHFGNFCFSQNDTPMEDFTDMINCGAHIIANSSFSLMAALLSSEFDEKNVIAPATWFGAALNHDTKDLLKPTWIKK